MLSPAMISLPWRPDAAEYYFSPLSSQPWAMLLHSGFAEHAHNRFDIIVAQPRATLVTHGQLTTLREGETVSTSAADPLTLVHQQLAHCNLQPQPHPHHPATRARAAVCDPGAGRPADGPQPRAPLQLHPE